MRRATLLVIFEFLAQSYEEWRKTGKVASDAADGSFVLKKPEPGERLALLRLEAEIERILPEIFSPEYQQLLAEEKQRLVQESYGSGRQQS
jgi:hypothetical protein